MYRMRGVPEEGGWAARVDAVARTPEFESVRPVLHEMAATGFVEHDAFDAFLADPTVATKIPTDVVSRLAECAIHESTQCPYAGLALAVVALGIWQCANGKDL